MSVAWGELLPTPCLFEVSWMRSVVQQLNRGVASADLEGFAPVAHGGAEVADQIDR